jgi:ubiquinone biosynthesis protein UbiJ
LQAAIQTSETNLARGYAEEHRMVAGSAQVVRVPLDTAKERQRLAGLQARLGPLQAKTASAVAVCGG